MYNIIWFPIWLMLMLWNFILWFFYLITIIWIPFAIVHFRVWKVVLLPIWVRVLSEDKYIAYKVEKELKKQSPKTSVQDELVNNNSNENSKINNWNQATWLFWEELNTTFYKEEENIELSEEDKKQIQERKKELELLKIEEEKERIRKKKELNEKINKNISIIKEFIIKYFNITKKYLIVNYPFLREKLHNTNNKIISNLKDIDSNKYKEKTLNINKNYKLKKYFILLVIILFTAFVWNYSYNNFYYYNQIIKVWDNIKLKKEPWYINYFNNNKIKIWLKDSKFILSQYLMTWRSYINEYYDTDYKIWWYIWLYDKKWAINENFEDIKKSVEKKELTLKMSDRGNLTLLSIDEDIDNMNLYKLKLFKELNRFTNRNMFFSSISKNEDTKISNSKVSEKIQELFELENVLESLNFSLFKSDDKAWILENALIWLELNWNKLIVRIKYNYKNLTNINKDIIKDLIYQSVSDINEESIINYTNHSVNIDKNSIDIKTTYKISDKNLGKILSDNSLNNFNNLYKFSTTNNYY